MASDEDSEESIEVTEIVADDTNDDNKVINTADTKTLDCTDCIHVMEQVYNGNYMLLPLFAQSLITYLNTDIPNSDNPRILADHVARRGMFVLQKAFELGTNEKDPEIMYKYVNSLKRDMLSILCALLYMQNHMVKSIILFIYIVKTSHEYKVSNQKQYIDFVMIIAFAYIWCV